MARDWICSQCGMSSTRRGNVLRHIDNKHGRDKAEPVRSIEGGKASYKRGSQTIDDAPSQSIYKQSRSANNTIEEIVNRQVTKFLEQRISELTERTSLGSPDYKAYFCKKCLCIDILPVDLRDDENHFCNSLWSINYWTQISADRDLVSSYIKSQVPKYLVYAIKKLLGDPGKILLAASDMTESVKLERTPFVAPTTHRDSPAKKANLKLISDLTNLQLKNIDKEIAKQFPDVQPISLGIGNSHHWSNRVTQYGKTELNDNELLEFLTVRLSSYLILEVAGRYYFVRIIKRN